MPENFGASGNESQEYGMFDFFRSQSSFILTG
jgi:hypothetical protein